MSRALCAAALTVAALLGSAGVAAAAGDTTTCGTALVCAPNAVHADSLGANLINNPALFHVDTLHVFG